MGFQSSRSLTEGIGAGAYFEKKEKDEKIFESLRTELQREVKESANPPSIGTLPILHNKDVLFLQFCGWSINLYANGTWTWEDTTGG